MKIETFDSVWDAVSDTPEQAENMRIRAELVTIINNWIEQLARGKIQIFSIDKLITMMAHAGLHIQRIEIQYPHAA